MQIKKLATVLLVIGLIGCAAVPLTHTGKYYDALATFNDLVESYIWHYNQVDVEKQAVLKKYVNPVLFEANTALDIWGQNPASVANMQTYNIVFKKLQLLLIKYGVGGKA